MNYKRGTENICTALILFARPRSPKNYDRSILTNPRLASEYLKPNFRLDAERCKGPLAHTVLLDYYLFLLV